MINKTRLKIQKKQVLWILCSLLLVCCVFMTIQGASTGAQLLVLEEEKLELIAENQKLSAQLVESTSLIKMEEIAKDLGYYQPKDTLYISEKKAVAKLP